jgi:hypothetical protein
MDQQQVYVAVISISVKERSKSIDFKVTHDACDLFNLSLSPSVMYSQ